MNQQVMMRKLMKMKQEMEETQQEIFDTEFRASAGGIVEVVVEFLPFLASSSLIFSSLLVDS